MKNGTNPGVRQRRRAHVSQVNAAEFADLIFRELEHVLLHGGRPSEGANPTSFRRPDCVALRIFYRPCHTDERRRTVVSSSCCPPSAWSSAFSLAARRFRWSSRPRQRSAARRTSSSSRSTASGR